MRYFSYSFLLIILLSFSSYAQQQYIDSIQAPKDYENIYLRPLYSDSLSSSFVIFIKKEVKPHKHIYHTEQVYILDGEGEMLLGEKSIIVKKGDIIFIPKNTVHSLKNNSNIPVKVLSVQSPYFDGTDRVAVELH
jgi:mannose-6-phosphate isomerase-like protein (cupin superfamily)